MMGRATSLCYGIRLIYVGTESIEINIERIKERVRKGGHDVPEEDQRRRYPRSFANLKAALELADEGILFDNSSPEGHRKIALKDATGITFFPPIPEWAKSLEG
jgi:predicted ABC-type ATPase